MVARTRLGAALAVTWLALAPGTVSADTGSGSLSLRPTHGQASAPFTATFSEPGVLSAGCPPATVTFSWDTRYQVGSAPLGGPNTAGNCTASVTIVPPAADRAPGGHTVVGDDGTGNTGAATYTVDRPPSPSPTAAHSSTASPSPSRSPTPAAAPASPRRPPNSLPSAAVGSPAPAPPPQCAAFPPINPFPDYAVAHFDGVPGSADAQPFAGWSVISALGPGALLPPLRPGGRYPAAEVTKRVDGGSSQLARHLSSGAGFDCVAISLGPTGRYFYARYVFEQVRLISIRSGGGLERIRFSYRDVYFEYRAIANDNIGPLVSGEGWYQSAAAAANGFDWPLLGGGLAAVLAAALGGVVLIRRPGWL